MTGPRLPSVRIIGLLPFLQIHRQVLIGSALSECTVCTPLATCSLIGFLLGPMVTSIMEKVTLMEKVVETAGGNKRRFSHVFRALYPKSTIV